MDSLEDDMAKVLSCTLEMLRDMTSHDYTLGKDKPIRNRIEAVLKRYKENQEWLKNQKLDCGHTMADWMESGMGTCGACDRGEG